MTRHLHGSRELAPSDFESFLELLGSGVVPACRPVWAMWEVRVLQTELKKLWHP
ncbi:hypothetical protein Hanom_Chr09g00850231 [Helianthus anomalus]